MARILLVEDDPDYCETMEALLTVKGHSVEPVGNGLEALEHMRTGSYDLVILDWHLPQMDGVDVLKEFRSGGGKTPVLMLTGEAEKAQVKVIMEAGADDWLQKPCTLEDLVSRIEKLMLSKEGA